MRRKSAALTTSQVEVQNETVEERKAKPKNQETVVHARDAPIGREDNHEWV